MQHKEKIEQKIQAKGFENFSWVNPQDIVVANWVRMKCMYGCPGYGLGACPPNTPTIETCKQFFNEYSSAIFVWKNTRAIKGKYPSEWSNAFSNDLLELEKEIFLLNNPKAFLLNQTCCDKCKDCAKSRENCSDKQNTRPSPEALGVDVFQTARKFGVDINVIHHLDSEIIRIGIILVE